MADEVPNAARVRDALKTVLSSPMFAGSERLKDFLRYITEETLQGRGEHIKDYVVGVEVYHKSPSFDTRTDSSVRVEASRLRSKLTQYYEAEGKDDEIVISVPKGSYIPIFTVRNVAPLHRPAPAPLGVNRRVILVGLSLGVLVCTIWFFASRKKILPPAYDLSPLTTYPGYERNPSFSPDGTQVAFSWDGGVREGSENIYVKVIGSESAVRLTNNGARELSPAWSPDGRSIAFLRFLGTGRAEIITIPALGGSERKLGETRSVVTPGYFPGHQLTWSPNGEWLCYSDILNDNQGSQGLVLHSVLTGERRPLTVVPSSVIADRGPAFSPDGRWLAFCRVESVSVSDIYLQHLSPDHFPVGQLRRLTSERRHTTAVSWLPLGQEVIFASGMFDSDRAIFKIGIGEPRRKPERLVGSGEDVDDVAVAQGGKRIAYTRRLEDSNIWRVDLTDEPGPSSYSLIASTRSEQAPQISPDGQHVAFSSGRSGTREVWVSDADGSNPARLTSIGGPLTSNPAWSPDGQKVAFDSRFGGSTEIFVVSARGGAPHKITSGPQEQYSPSWSHDGKFIYFQSGKGSNWQIWRIPAEGGAATQITRNGGESPKESGDGRAVYYAKEKQLWKVPSTGGREELASPELIDEYAFAVTPGGVYFIPAAGTPGRDTIRYFSFSTRKVKELVRLRKNSGLGLTVSPDERSLLYSQFDLEGSDLMLIESSR
jgi:Tol biopolymer transport system component